MMEVVLTDRLKINSWLNTIAEMKRSLASEIQDLIGADAFNFTSEPIARIDDISKIPTCPAFYVICCNYSGPEVHYNVCEYKSTGSGLTAIYRGHAYNCQKRLKGHIFTSRLNVKDNPARMQLFATPDERGIYGVNIDNDERLRGIRWEV